MRVTEQGSLHDDLENKSVTQLLHGINEEDQKVADAVKLAIPQIAKFVEDLVKRMRLGGRLFYIGAGTSGRLGVLDASECPPTFGIDDEQVVGIIAGGDGAIRKAVEHAEDDNHGAWRDLQPYKLTHLDTVVGIAASGTTPYVIGGVHDAREEELLTACITCNPNSPLALAAQYPIEVVVGPEFITGSTRMKSGTAQKMVLNMISTTAMIQLGKVKGNKMVDMRISNQKLTERGSSMVAEATGLPLALARTLLEKYGSVRAAISAYGKQ